MKSPPSAPRRESGGREDQWPGCGLPPAPGVAVAKVAPLAEPPMPLSIKRITLQGGNIAYSDRFIKPNYDANLHRHGRAFHWVCSSDPNTIAELDLKIKVDNVAPVEVVGRLNPFRPGSGAGYPGLR